MKINLDPWQEEIKAARGNILLCKGRRIGGTEIFAEKAVDEMMYSGKPVIVVSLTEEQAMIIIQMAKNYILSNYPEIIGKGKYKPTLKTLTVMRKNDKGTLKPILMKSRPVGNTGDATRGFEGGTLFVDEASRMPMLFWMAAKPILLTQAGKLWINSTPHGKTGYFWKSFNEAWNLKLPKAKFTTVIFKNTEDVMMNREISESWTIEQREGALQILEEEKRDMSEFEYGQEYLGLFMEELMQFFDDEWISKVCTIENEEHTPNRTRDYFLGVDVGRVIDPSTFEILDGTDENNRFQVYHNEITQISIPGTFREIRRLEWQFISNKIGVDSGGMGAGVLDLLLEDSDTRRKSEGLDNATKVVDDEESTKPLLKEEMYIDMLVQGEMGKLHLFKNMEIMASLKSVQYEHKEGGKIRIFGKNTHSTEGLIRSNRLIKTKGLKCFITSL